MLSAAQPFHFLFRFTLKRELRQKAKLHDNVGIDELAESSAWQTENKD